MKTKLLAAGLVMAAVASAQAPVHAESTSSIHVSGKALDQTIEIHNVTYQYSSTRVPGRPDEERLALRVTTHNKDVIGDIPEPGAVTIEAWPLGVDLRQKPIYTVKVGGDDAHIVDNALWVVNRGFVDVPMWSIYKLGTGQHLFDTYVEMVRFSISRDVQTPRYAGLEVPPDDTPDARLKDPHVMGVLTYASEDKVIRELLLTHSNPAKARELRAYEDTVHTLVFVAAPARGLRVKFGPSEMWVPLKGDDMDAAGARVPVGVRIAPFQRKR